MKHNRFLFALVYLLCGNLKVKLGRPSLCDFALDRREGVWLCRSDFDFPSYEDLVFAFVLRRLSHVLCVVCEDIVFALLTVRLNLPCSQNVQELERGKVAGICASSVPELI